MFLNKLLDSLQKDSLESEKYRLVVDRCFKLHVFNERGGQFLQVCPEEVYLRCSLGEFRKELDVDDVLYMLGALAMLFDGLDGDIPKRPLSFWKHKENVFFGSERCSFLVYHEGFFYHTFFRLYLYLFRLLGSEVSYKEWTFGWEGFSFGGYFVSWRRVYVYELLAFFSFKSFVKELVYGDVVMRKVSDGLAVFLGERKFSYSLFDFGVLKSLFFFYGGRL